MLLYGNSTEELKSNTDFKNALEIVQLEYLELTVRRREAGEVLVVAGRAPACWLVWRGMQYRRSQAFITELETSTLTQSKQMTNHNTPQLSGMDSANHCATFPGLSALSTTTVT
jgi:meiotically up-regulated gene 157 (Mug157) protein